MTTRILSKMKKTIPFYLLHSLSAAAILTLTACGPTPVKPVEEKKKQPDAVDVSHIETKTVIEAEQLKPLTETEIREKITLAQQQQNWVKFVQLNQQIWQTADETTQVDIEQTLWQTLNQQDFTTTENIRNQLTHSEDTSVQAWAALIEAIKGPVSQLQNSLSSLIESHPDAIYHHNVLPELQTALAEISPAQQIAVLLPFQGKYQHVSAQIRSGIMQAFFASDQTTTLKFYDSSDLERLETVYQQAKLEGADFVIGPLRKSAIEQLSHIADENMLTLNKGELGQYTQFSFKSADEVSQMVKQFKALGYQNIGILSNDSRGDYKLASALKTAWQADKPHTAVLSTYPDQTPKLRNALGDLINEGSSKARYNTLRWATGRTLSFFPRTRQDFDAIVIVDDRRRMAVFKPQFAFFELDMPLYGSSQLTPKKFQKIETVADLAGVQFLTYPATLTPGSLLSKFEAFGWDSFQIAKHMPQMKLGSTLDMTKTGKLSLQDQLIAQHLVWVKYNRKGQLEAVASLAQSLPEPSKLIPNEPAVIEAVAAPLPPADKATSDTVDAASQPRVIPSSAP
ncbi:MAG: hypothetical protein GXO35_08560 [Gammaproteobacteria bacterium]|nr:hypothetical protein [Gammaproteobacteria bacterium]